MGQMLLNIGSYASVSREESQARMEVLEKKLARLQIKIMELSIPVAIFFDGWSAAGKGTLIGKALEVLDPRHFKVHSMEKVTEEQRLRPFLWPYAVNMPVRGKIAIFDKSYYMSHLPDSDMVSKKVSKNSAGIYYDIKAFEQQLLDSGTVVLKYFLHVSKDEQARRFKELMGSENTRWRVTEKDLAQNIEYKRYYDLFDEMLDKSKSCPAKWAVLDANDKRSAALGFYEDVVAKLTMAVEKKLGTGNEILEASTTPDDKVPDLLSKADLTKTISDEKYQKQIKQYQEQVSALVYKLYRKRRAVAAVFEGWDAAGKGGSIKRLTQEMDPRGYNVYPVAAPTLEEKQHHYLWRFWKGLPKDGHMTIFDRSWYGRVLVERAEGFCTESEWRRAYKEINDFELHLHRHGVILLKFWMHVSSKEQLYRFESRASNPEKQHKITEEDWRNRSKREQYYAAVNEMLHKTSTDYATWVVVESESKKFARIKVLEHVVKTLSQEL